MNLVTRTWRGEAKLWHTIVLGAALFFLAQLWMMNSRSFIGPIAEIEWSLPRAILFVSCALFSIFAIYLAGTFWLVSVARCARKSKPYVKYAALGIVGLIVLPLLIWIAPSAFTLFETTIRTLPHVFNDSFYDGLRQ